VVSREKAADVERRLRQNKNDVEGFSTLLKTVEVQTAETNTKVDNLATEVASLRTDVSQLDTRVGTLEVKVDAGFDQVNDRFDRVNDRFDRVNEKFDQVNHKFDQVNGRFDRLEQLLVPSADEPEGKDVLRAATERRLGFLGNKV
jgi:predicted nuclease with TOPRIM domain